MSPTKENVFPTFKSLPFLGCSLSECEESAAGHSHPFTHLQRPILIVVYMCSAQPTQQDTTALVSSSVLCPGNTGTRVKLYK